MSENLVADLREDAEWAEANIWEVPIMLPDHLKAAADRIEQLEKRETWVSAEERIPDIHIDGRFAIPASSTVAFRTENKTIHLGYVMQESFGGSTCGDGFESSEIYHWYDQRGERIEDVTEWKDLSE